MEPGTVTGFLGLTGAGKTTALRMVLGLVKADAGTATFDGVPYSSLSQPLRTVGAVLDTAFHPARSGRNHLLVCCRAEGLPRQRADEVLAQVGLAHAGQGRAGGYSLTATFQGPDVLEAWQGDVLLLGYGLGAAVLGAFLAVRRNIVRGAGRQRTTSARARSRVGRAERRTETA